MPRTVTYYDTAEVIAMLKADHEREFVSSSGHSAAIAYRTPASPPVCATTEGVKRLSLCFRDDWQLTKGKP